jgi:hypothetical protein
MKKIALFAASCMAFTCLFLSCGSGISADYGSLRTKQLILIGDDGKDYLLEVKKDAEGKPKLEIRESK